MRRAAPVARHKSKTTVYLRGVSGRDETAAGNGGLGRFGPQNQHRRDDLVRYRSGLRDAAAAEARNVFHLFGTVDEILSHAFRYGRTEFLLSARHAHRTVDEQNAPPLIVEVAHAPRGLTRRTLLTHHRNSGGTSSHIHEAAE